MTMRILLSTTRLARPALVLASLLAISSSDTASAYSAANPNIVRDATGAPLHQVKTKKKARRQKRQRSRRQTRRRRDQSRRERQRRNPSSRRRSNTTKFDPFANEGGGGGGY